MKPSIQINKRVLIVCATPIVVVAVALLAPGRTRDVWRQTISYLQQIQAKPADGTLRSPGKNSNTPNAKAAVDLSPSQLTSIKIEPVGTYQFPVDKETVGNISFADEQSVQVFPAFQGTIIKAFAELGSQVEKDQPLYTIKSPDLIQAESTLIGAAAQFELTKKELERVKGLPGVAQREVEQATSDEQTADGALKAAIDAVRVFGKTDAEIDQMIASRKTDPALLWFAAPSPARLRRTTRRRVCWCSPGIRPRPIPLQFSQLNGCWRMSWKATSPCSS